MKKIGIFLDEILDQRIDTNQKFSKLGYNTGNMLFWHSLKTQLDLDVKSRWYIDHIDQLDLNEYKAFVTTDLIWIRQMQDFSYLNKTLDVLGDLPLIPISIGLQCDDYDYDFKLHPETVKVLNRISERCIMGVRGNYTAEILKKHGISNFQVIGCPSMYMPVDGFKTVSNHKKDIKKVSMNFETFYNKLDDKRIEFLEYGVENGFDFVEQAQAELEEKHIENHDVYQKVKKWIDSNGNIFFELDDWREYIREHDFSIGLRFHGNVLALWEGVPALFVSCDSRTKELCEFFNLPMIDINDFDNNKSVEEYFELSNYYDFHNSYYKRNSEWKEFLNVNNLKKKKVLYICYFPTVVIQSFSHKCVVNKDCDSSIILYNYFKKDNRFLDVFNDVIYANDVNYVHFIDDEQKIEFEIEKYYTSLLNDNNIKLEDFEEIYVSCDMVNDFAIYLSLKNYKYNYFESFINQLNENRYNLYDYHIKNENVHGSAAYFNVSKKHFSICGLSPLCKKRFLMAESQCCNIKDENINFSKLLLEMTDSEKEILVDSFDNFGIREMCNNAKDSTLLLTQRQWKYPVTLEETGVLYQFLADYFCHDSKSISIKPHPSDKYNHSDFFNDSVIFPVGFPADLFPIIDEFSIKNAITVSSTSIQKLDQSCNNLIMCGDIYFCHWRNINKYYYALKVIEMINKSDDSIFRNNIPDGDDFLKLMREYAFGGTNFNESQWISLSYVFDGVALVGDIVFDDKYLSYSKYYNMLNNLSDNSVIIFLDLNNNKKIIDFEHYHLFDYLYSFKIKKTAIKENVWCNMDDEQIHVFCKNPKIVSPLLKNSLEFTLNNVGVKLNLEYVEGSSLKENALYIKVKSLSSNNGLLTILNDIKVEKPVLLENGTYQVNKIGAFSIIHHDFSSVRVESIGRYANIALSVQLGTQNHPINFLSSHNLFDPGCRFSKLECIKNYHNYENTTDNIKDMIACRDMRPDRVTVGNDVWIGNDVIVLSGVTIGDGAIIGAGAVVTKDVPPYAIVGGIPAKIIKYRFSEKQIEKLLELKWWDYEPGILSNLNLTKIDESLEIIEERIKNGYPKLNSETFILKKNI